MGDHAAPAGAGSGMPPGGLDAQEFFWLLIIATVVAMVARRIRIPYALALVITGLAVGAPHLLPQAHLDSHMLFTVFLPPLLFESAIQIRIEPLRRDIRTILVYALGGTLLSTLVVGWLTAAVLSLPLAVALVFAALISSTDPISVVAVFKRLGVGKRLSLLVEAESLFNDGASVVLFTVLADVALGGSLTAAGAIQKFLTVVIGGAAVGVGVGGLASRVTREFDDHLLEVMLTTVAAFGAYACAEAVHVSGVIAVVMAGLVVGNWGMQTGMAPSTRLAVTTFWEYAAFVVNSFVFLLLGIEVSFVNLFGSIGPLLAAVGIVLLGRATAVYGLSLLANRFRGDVPFAWQHVLFWGGLRGALSVALVLGLGLEFPHRDTLVVITFGVVLFSLLGQGLTLGPLLGRLGLSNREPTASEQQKLLGGTLACRAGILEMDRLQAKGILPRAICDEVRAQYHERISALEGRVEELHLSSQDLRRQQLDEALRFGLMAEKTALHEAEREGILDEEPVGELIGGIDERLMELQGGSGH